MLFRSHLDHIATLPIFLENVYEPGPGGVEVLASRTLLDLLHGDMFNDRVWPDFIELSRPDDAFMTTTAIEPMRPVSRAGLAITPVPVSHVVETMGLVVDDGRSVVAFPSDTGPTRRLWEHLATLDRLRAVFLEVSFPQALAGLAAQTGHLCPATFAAEVGKLPRNQARDVRWIVVHRKARYAAEIAREVAALGLPNVELVKPGHIYDL